MARGGLRSDRAAPIRPEEASLFSRTSEFARNKTCDRLTPAPRSHSHTVARVGRSNVSRKSDLNPSWGNSTARNLAGSLGKVVRVPHTWSIASRKTSAISRLAGYRAKFCRSAWLLAVGALE